MTMLSDGMLLGVGGAQAASASFIGATSGSTSTPQTFNNVAIGDADANRVVVVVVMHNSTSGPASITSVTIGGVTATLVQSSISRSGICIAYASLATGTTTSISVTADNAQNNNMRIAVFRVIAASPTPADTGVVVASSGNATPSDTLAGVGAIVWGCCTGNTGGSISVTPTNATIDDTSPLSVWAQRAGQVPAPASAFSVTFGNALSDKALVSVGWA